MRLQNIDEERVEGIEKKEIGGNEGKKVSECNRTGRLEKR